MKRDFIVRRSITMIDGKPHVETYSEQELVRCKNCNNRGTSDCPIEELCNGWIPSDDWFCADGERRSE